MTMDLRGKNVLIVGFERTGEALARFLVDRGARVRVTDKKPAEALGTKIGEFAARGVVFETGGHRMESFLGADLIVPSPGVPPIAEVRAARDKGVPVLSEIELAYLFLRGRIIGLTGSNGKSTTATLVHRILADAGLRARLAGNIGTPLISFVDRSRDDDLYVTEISSFQLEYTERFTPAVAALLNVSENHIDWHGTFESYFAAKKKLLTRMGPEGRAVLNRDDARVWKLREETEARVYGFSRRRRPARGAYVEDGWVVVRDGAPERVLPAARIPLPGAHNLENVLAAALIGRLLGVTPASMRRTIRAFHGLEHRLEDVQTVRGVRFVNDSKATTVDATLKALASFDRPVVLILGGRGKGGDYGPLRPAVRRQARSVVLVGEAADKIAQALGGAVPVDRAADYREVVRTAFARARRGDVVLLAPAATSWDMFKNFEERGRTFKREVRRLAAGLRRKEAGR
jgi:UDP-N-acetylmuramoylalanine--D-glutamate ligase